MISMTKLSDESHLSHQVAKRWHLAHAAVYGLLIVLYTGAAWWHIAAARRHARST